MAPDPQPQSLRDQIWLYVLTLCIVTPHSGTEALASPRAQPAGMRDDIQENVIQVLLIPWIRWLIASKGPKWTETNGKTLSEG